MEYVVRDNVGKGLRWGGGFVFFGGGSRKGGFGRTPRIPPPWLRAWWLLSGAYARGSKRSHTGGKCVTCCNMFYLVNNV